MSSLAQHITDTNTKIKNIAKPLSAYQYYSKAMLEQWHNMSESQREEYITLSNNDKLRYQNQKNSIYLKSADEIKKQNIFLRRTVGRVPCIGLDNGFTTYEVIGPVDNVELFTEIEKKKLIDKGVDSNNIGNYKSVGGYKFNWRAAKKYSVTVYGGNTNNNESWWGIRENYTGEKGIFTIYNNYKGDVWTVNY